MLIFYLIGAGALSGGLTMATHTGMWGAILMGFGIGSLTSALITLERRTRGL